MSLVFRHCAFPHNPKRHKHCPDCPWQSLRMLFLVWVPCFRKQQPHITILPTIAGQLFFISSSWVLFIALLSLHLMDSYTICWPRNPNNFWKSLDLKGKYIKWKIMEPFVTGLLVFLKDAENPLELKSIASSPIVSHRLTHTENYILLQQFFC